MNEDLKDWETNFDAIDAYKYKDESGFYYSSVGKTYFFLRNNPYSEGLLRIINYKPLDHTVYCFQMIGNYSRVNFRTITELKDHYIKVKHITNNTKFDIDLIIKDLQERYG